ncbi:MAG: Flp pilus assembly protein TadB [Bermanella sp.]|jgi:Flp pilus assembly protein TadB
MATELAVVTITHAIQQSVAPVFLLAGIGGILNVLTNRLARIIDRSRNLHARLESVSEERVLAIRDELNTLTQRGRIVHRAIAYSTGSALLVCVVIAMLFLGAVMSWNNSIIVAGMFILAMCFLIVSLSGFLREIRLATRIMLNGP